MYAMYQFKCKSDIAPFNGYRSSDSDSEESEVLNYYIYSLSEFVQQKTSEYVDEEFGGKWPDIDCDLHKSYY